MGVRRGLGLFLHFLLKPVYVLVSPHQLSLQPNIKHQHHKQIAA
jgi:hypothetical protein